MKIIAQIIDSGQEILNKTFELIEEQQISVGRQDDNNIVIPRDFISRKHAILFVEKNSLYIKDMNSSNGTFVNAKKIDPTKPYNISNETVIITFSEKDTFIQVILSIKSGSIPLQNQTNKKITSYLSILKSNGKLTIGRLQDNDIVIEYDSVSRHHATIELKDGKYIYTDHSTNGSLVNNNHINNKSLLISENTPISIAGQTIILATNTQHQQKGNVSQIGSKIADMLIQKQQIVLGRASECDIQLESNFVSRKHAKFFTANDKTYIEDLGSSNGTYLNGRLITSKTTVTKDDEIIIGNFKFNIGSSKVKNLQYEVAVQAVNISKVYPNGKIGLQELSFNIPSNSFVALMGPSGCGKTTLLRSLNGSNPASKGKVLIKGLDLNKEFDVIKRIIGYVPQDDIVHKELTVDQSLFYAAKLKLPKTVSEKEIKERIAEVLDALNINDAKLRKDKIKDLSGGQRKRVSIAVELLTKPSILFLDEPTSPLDPETIAEFLNTLRKLIEKENITIVMVTHKPEDLKYVDKIIFLATGGYGVFYGNKEDLFQHFQVDDIISIYSLVNLPNNTVKNYYQNFLNYHKSNITHSKSEKITTIKDNAFIQFYWLVMRYFKIKFSDKYNLMLLFLQPIIIALLIGFIFDKLMVGILFMMAISGIWFGVINASKEIVNEEQIYIRERMFNLNISSYIGSKIFVLSVFGFVQTIIFVFTIAVFYYKDDVFLAFPMKQTLYLFIIVFSATLMGLLMSAVFKTSEQVMTFVPLALIPQLILAGVVVRINTPLKEVLSYATLGRWGTEILARVQTTNEKFTLNQTDSLLIDNNQRMHVVSYNDQHLPISDKQQVLYDTVVNAKEIYENIYTQNPSFYVCKDTMLLNEGIVVPYNKSTGLKYEKADAMEMLGFYDKNNKNMLEWFNSMNKNLLALFILDIFTLLAIIITLKRKDPIK